MSVRGWLLKPDGSSKSPILWNALGSGLFVGQAAIVLMFASRVYTLEEAGTLSLAYAVANLFLALSKFGMRNYQVTDRDENYPFASYGRSRLWTILGTLVLAMGYATWQFTAGVYDSAKVMIVLEVTLLKLVDAGEDLFAARYQQVGHFVTGAKLVAVHQGLVTALMCVLVMAGMSLPSMLFVAVWFSGAVLALLVRITWQGAGKPDGRASSLVDVVNLLHQCLPLCIGAALSIYAGNMPKYAIDAFLDDATQAVFGYIMLPVFVVTLLNQFMYQPFVKDLGDLWTSGDVRGFRRRVGMHCAAVLVVAVVTLVACMWVGLPLLSAVYALDLTGYDVEFVVLMVGGVLYTLSTYLSVPLTAMRTQRSVAVGYGVSCAASVLLQVYVVPTLGLMGASVLYVAQNALLLLVFAVAFVFTSGRSARED